MLLIHCFASSLVLLGRNGNAGNCDIAVHCVQGAELLNDQEQEDDHGASGVLEVL